MAKNIRVWSLKKRAMEGGVYLSQPNVSNPCKWRGQVCFIEEESQGFLEKPQERVKAFQRRLTKRVKLLEEARPKGSSFLKKLDKRSCFS